MSTFQEGGLEFCFGDSWHVVKYDEEGGFYRTKLAKSVAQTKAMDFLCLHNSKAGPLLILEVKDFSMGKPIGQKFREVPLAVAIKARDTVAGIVGGSHLAPENERRFFWDSYRRMTRSPFVVYFFEDLASPARRPPERMANERDVLSKQLKSRLRWLTREVVVVGLNDYSSFIEDLAVRRITQ